MSVHFISYFYCMAICDKRVTKCNFLLIFSNFFLFFSDWDSQTYFALYNTTHIDIGKTIICMADSLYFYKIYWIVHIFLSLLLLIETRICWRVYKVWCNARNKKKKYYVSFVWNWFICWLWWVLYLNKAKAMANGILTLVIF